ncbi:MAG TPA: DNA polymerase III subunit delta [Gelria sp.]|nr:DNA polymerase III subunit delta [Gelria sp.]
MATNNTYFIWGEEAFLIDQKIKEIHSIMQEKSGEEVELLYLDGDELSPLRLLEELEFSPLFSWQRMVVIKRPSWLGKSRRKTSRNQEILKVLQDYLQQESPGQTLIITVSEYNGSNALVKLLNKETTVIECKSAKPQELANWIKEEVSARGYKIDNAGLSLMVRSGQDMYYLYNLIEKLCLITEDQTISAKDIEEQLSSRDEIKVFKLTNALLDRDLQASCQAFYQLLEQGEHPVFILFMIVRQFVSLGKIKYYQENRTDIKEISRLTGMKDFAVRRLSGQVHNFSWDEIQYLFEKFLDADIKFKSTSQDEKTIMEGLLIEICSKK